MDTKSSFDSLTWALDGWFDKRFRELPGALRQRVKRDFFPKAWGKLTADQRRSVAHEWDFEHDPGSIANRRLWQRYLARKENLEKQIVVRKAEAARTADARAKKKADLAELEGELAFQAQQEQQERDNYQPERIPPVGARYIAYPKALDRLKDRLRATREELAAWVFMGPKVGGLAAYTNANELDPPPRFSFDYFMGEDYIAPLMRCWFWKDDIERFDPAYRYITGKTLIERWSKMPDIQPEAFIRAKIEESRLLDFHPTCGGSPDSNLFMLSHVEKVEAEDFPNDDIRSESPASGQIVDAILEEKIKQRISLNATKAANKRHEENRAMREQVIQHYTANESTYRSVEAAAKAIAGKIVPVAQRTVADWIREFKK